jgi:hypothetical protein
MLKAFLILALANIGLALIPGNEFALTGMIVGTLCLLASGVSLTYRMWEKDHQERAEKIAKDLGVQLVGWEWAGVVKIKGQFDGKARRGLEEAYDVLISEYR